MSAPNQGSKQESSNSDLIYYPIVPLSLPKVCWKHNKENWLFRICDSCQKIIVKKVEKVLKQGKPKEMTNIKDQEPMSNSQLNHNLEQ